MEQRAAQPRTSRTSPFLSIGYTLLSFPLAVLSCVFTVTLVALGIGLTPIGIGIPILYFALFIANRLHALDLNILDQMDAGRHSTERYRPFRRFPVREMFTNVTHYLPVVYAVVKLPISIAQFATALVFSVAGFALLFTPAVYLVLNRFGIDMLDGDVVMSSLFPSLTPYQHTFFGTGIGIGMVLVGFYCARQWTRFGLIAALTFEPQPAATDGFAVQSPDAPNPEEPSFAMAASLDAQPAVQPQAGPAL